MAKRKRGRPRKIQKEAPSNRVLRRLAIIFVSFGTVLFLLALATYKSLPIKPTGRLLPPMQTTASPTTAKSEDVKPTAFEAEKQNSPTEYPTQNQIKELPNTSSGEY